MDLPQRIHKPKFTDQDVRSEAIELRDELLANLRFIKACILKDRIRLEAYEQKFGDLRYRTILKEATDSSPAEYGAPTQVVLEPLASQYRATINSLLQSIRLIQSEILSPEDPEGATTLPTEAANLKRASLRASFLADATEIKPAIQPDDSLEPTELVESSKPLPKTHIKPTNQLKTPTQPKVISQAPKPWRETTPKSIKPTNESTNNETISTTIQIQPVDEPAPIATQSRPIGLSPALRARMQSSGSLAGLKAKYIKPTTEEND